MQSRVQTDPRSSVLAIEPDPARATTLARLLRDYVRADFELVNSTAIALRSLGDRIPDLVLTSAFLAPAEAAALVARLNQLPTAAHVQVITVPHFIDCDTVSPDDTSNILNFLKRRSELARPTCDPRTVSAHIEHYLERARAERLAQTARLGGDSRVVRRLTAGDVYFLSKGTGRPNRKQGRVHDTDRRRARRCRPGDLASPLAVKLPWDAPVSVINISRDGVLLESSAKITPGSTIDLHVVGDGKQLIVPSRTVRSEVAQVDAAGVRYLIAARFDRDVNLAFIESPGTAGAAAVVLEFRAGSRN